MSNFDQFKQLYAETMQYCQMLEWNIKCLYVLYFKDMGSKDDWNAICFETGKIKFGEAFNNLRQKDKDCKILSSKIYQRIYNFKGGRHYLAHDIYNKFPYHLREFEKYPEYASQYKVLELFHDWFKELAFDTYKAVKRKQCDIPPNPFYNPEYKLPWYIEEDEKKSK